MWKLWSRAYQASLSSAASGIIACFGNRALSWLQLSSKTTKRGHWNSLTYKEDGCCQIIVTFQANSIIISQILVLKYCLPIVHYFCYSKNPHTITCGLKTSRLKFGKKRSIYIRTIQPENWKSFLYIKTLPFSV